MDHQLTGDQRVKTEQEYLRNGFPSIVLAVVTIVLTAYSFWIIQPNIELIYKNIVSRNFEKLGLASTNFGASESKESESLAAPAAVLPESKASSSARMPPEVERNLLYDTELCLRRLAIFDAKNDSIRFETGVIAFALADWYRDRAWDLALSEPKSNQLGVYQARQEEEVVKAISSMRTVTQMKGPLAARALAKVVETSLRGVYPATTELQELQSTVQRFIDDNESKADSSGNKQFLDDLSVLRDLKARLATIQALTIDFELSDKDRMQLLDNAGRSFTEANRNDFISQSWRGLAELPFDREKAQDRAWGAVQEFWSRGTVERPRVEELDAVFRGLLVGGDLEEAQTFVFSQLKKLPSFEQSQFRDRSASTLLQQLVANQLIASKAAPDKTLSNATKQESKNPQNDRRQPEDAVLLDLAIRLQPEIEGLAEALIDLAGSSNSETGPETSLLRTFLRQTINNSSRDGLIGILEAIQDAKRGDLDGIDKSIARVMQDDLAYGLLATKVVMILVRTTSNVRMINDGLQPYVEHQAAVRWLKAINKASPQLLNATFALGTLHLNAKEFDMAIECFESLAKRLPDNPQIQEMLESARAR
jgi:tetratricopeptide (TPR) repeat protein